MCGQRWGWRGRWVRGCHVHRQQCGAARCHCPVTWGLGGEGSLRWVGRQDASLRWERRGRLGQACATVYCLRKFRYHGAAVPVGGFGWGDRRLFGRGCAGCTRRSSSVGTGENRGQSPGGWGGGSSGNNSLCHSGGCGGGVSFCSAAGRWGILSLRFICFLGSGGRSFGGKQRLAGNVWLLRRL